MSDLVERVARALAKEGGIQICDDATYALSSYRGPALAAIAAMQTDAAPALKPAVEVWREAVYDYGGASIEGTEAEYRAAAVIEADRAAAIAAKDAEIAELKARVQEEQDCVEAFRTKTAALQAHADALAEYAVHPPDCRIGQPDCLGEQELCTCGLSNALRAYEELSRE